MMSGGESIKGTFFWQSLRMNVICRLPLEPGLHGVESQAVLLNGFRTPPQAYSFSISKFLKVASSMLLRMIP